MLEDLHPSPQSSPREQALVWIIRLQSGEMSPEDRRAFEQWLDAHPAHQQEYARATEMWDALDHVPKFLDEELADVDHYWEQKVREASARGASWLWGWPPTITTISLALGILGCLVWLWPSSSVHQASYQTAKGEQQTVMLTDGSTLRLNTDSQVLVEISDERRIVHLERGEALFTVAPDPQRPFDVHAANGIIHDIGTEFLVRQSSNTVQVAVLKGRVAVEVSAHTPAISEKTSQLLRQGEEVFYTAEGDLSAVKPFNVPMTASWRQGQLVFVETPLRDVLNEWARYRTDAIRLSDPSLGHVPITGAFRLDNPIGFFRSLEDMLSLYPIRHGPNLIVLERQDH
ncbi:MAG: glycerol-3-phosphate ABC transporter substrate-binding protein [Nitrospirales bacterium]|nr:MAG: glycerol-3-phosphate ABC transporter substrate-binding protein [Nitrospirales bacterium]